jgi:hypothetical protein
VWLYAGKPAQSTVRPEAGRLKLLVWQKLNVIAVRAELVEA